MEARLGGLPQRPRPVRRLAGHGLPGLAAPVFDIDSVGLLQHVRGHERGAADARGRRRSSSAPTSSSARRDEPQAQRARGDAAVLQAAQEGRERRPVRDQPDRLQRPQGRRAPALDAAQRPRPSRCSPTSSCSRRRPRVPSTRAAIPGVVVSDELLALAERHGASPDRGAPSSSISRRQLAVARGLGFRRRLPRRTPACGDYGEILDRAAPYAGDDWRELAPGDPVPPARASSTSSSATRTGLSSDDREPPLSGVEAQARRRELRVPLQVPLQPAAARPPCSPDAPLVRGRARVLPARRAASRPGRQGCPRARAGGQGAAVRVPRLRRLLAPGHRLRLSRSRSARRTSATARAAAPATACARSATRSASGRWPTNDSRPTARRNRCSRAGRRQGQRAGAARAHGPTRSSVATTSRNSTMLVARAQRRGSVIIDIGLTSPSGEEARRT